MTIKNKGSYLLLVTIAYSVAATIYYMKLRFLYAWIDHHNLATKAFLVYFTFPAKALEFALVGLLSFFIVKKYKKLPVYLYYLLPLLPIALIFFLDMDFYHWSYQGEYFMGKPGAYLNRSIFWKLFLPNGG